MLTVYFVRHGQTECSVQNRYCGGGCDAELNDNGLLAADALASSLSSFPWNAIYASPQKRAQQTVTPLATRVGLEVRSEPDFAEIRYGKWDGKTPAQLTARADRTYRAWLADPARLAPPGGETAAEVKQRVLRGLSRVRQAVPEGLVLVAAHKTSIRVLLCALLGIDIGRYRSRIAQPLGGLSVVSFRPGGPRLERLGDLSHLPSSLRELTGN